MDEWIKCSDKLPEDNKIVLIGGIRNYDKNFSYFLDTMPNAKKTGFAVYHKITHWQPLPHPPKDTQ